MNKAKHSDVTFCDEEKAAKLINDPFFTFAEEYNNKTFEVNNNYNNYLLILWYNIQYFIGG